jgi:hypothetical protein
MWRSLSYGLGQSPRKEKSRFGCSGTSQWTRENPVFLPVVHRDSRPPGARKSMSLVIFCWFKPFLTKFFLNFRKISICSNFGGTTKNLSFAQKTLPFFRKKKSQKSGKSSGFLIFFLLSWIVVLPTCRLKTRFWNKFFLCSPYKNSHLNLFTHTEKIRNATRGCRLWQVKNCSCENSSPTEVKRTFNFQNLSIFITKSMRNFCQTKSSPQNQRTYT